MAKCVVSDCCDSKVIGEVQDIDAQGETIDLESMVNDTKMDIKFVCGKCNKECTLKTIEVQKFPYE